MERCCSNPLLINIDKSEAVYCLFCEEERVLSYSVKYRFLIIFFDLNIFLKQCFALLGIYFSYGKPSPLLSIGIDATFWKDKN